MKRHHTVTHGESIAWTTLTCAECDEEFERRDGEVVEAENYFCSMGCKGDFENEFEPAGDIVCPYDGCDHQSSELGIQQHHKRTHGESLTERTEECDWCGDEYTRQRSKIRRFSNSFCSKGCKYECLTVKFSEERIGEDNPMYGRDGEDHPNWTGGYDQNYGSGWLQARRKTLERDDYECQDCGMDREEHYEQFGCDLDVHHKTPFRTFEDTEAAHELSNLVTYCKQCHMTHEYTSETAADVAQPSKQTT